MKALVEIPVNFQMDYFLITRWIIWWIALPDASGIPADYWVGTSSNLHSNPLSETVISMFQKLLKAVMSSTVIQSGILLRVRVQIQIGLWWGTWFILSW
jgi:hypothetical protein